MSDPAIDIDIDLDAPLGDASEVYGAEVQAPTGFRAETPYAAVTTDDQPPTTVTIDEIHDGAAWLTMVAEMDDAEFSTLTKLSAPDARALGYALLRAADYIDRQGMAQTDD